MRSSLGKLRHGSRKRLAQRRRGGGDAPAATSRRAAGHNRNRTFCLERQTSLEEASTKDRPERVRGVAGALPPPRGGAGAPAPMPNPQQLPLPLRHHSDPRAFESDVLGRGGVVTSREGPVEDAAEPAIEPVMAALRSASAKALFGSDGGCATPCLMAYCRACQKWPKSRHRGGARDPPPSRSTPRTPKLARRLRARAR